MKLLLHPIIVHLNKLIMPFLVIVFSLKSSNLTKCCYFLHKHLESWENDAMLVMKLSVMDLSVVLILYT